MVASGAASPSAGLVYGTTRYFGQITRFQRFVLTDINNDGVLDLVVPQFGMSNIAISLGDATHPGTFLPPVFVSTVTYVDSVAVGDLNGDGLPDIVVADTDDHYAGILLQNPAHPGTFLGAKYVGATQSKPLIADMNRDGIPDLVLFPSDSGQYATSGVAVLPGDPLNPGSFLAPTTVSLGGAEIRSVALADMNGDGLQDVVIGNYTAQTVSILLNDSAHPGNLLPKTDYPSGSMFDLAIGDMNVDGRPDVVLGSFFPGGVTILLGSTANPGQLLPPHSYPVTVTPSMGGSLGVATGDIDGDGIPDVVSGTSGASFDVLLGNGDGTLKAPTAYATGPTPDTFDGLSMATGDVDGDGLTDVVVGQFYQNSAQIFLHQPSPVSLAITATDMSLSGTVVGLGDSLTITIKVSSFHGPPPGSIALYDSGGSATYSLIATLPLDGAGTATYTTSTLQPSFHDFVALFAGDSFYAPSTSLIDNVVVVNRADSHDDTERSAEPRHSWTKRDLYSHHRGHVTGPNRECDFSRWRERYRHRTADSDGRCSSQYEFAHYWHAYHPGNLQRKLQLCFTVKNRKRGHPVSSGRAHVEFFAQSRIIRSVRHFHRKSYRHGTHTHGQRDLSGQRQAGRSSLACGRWYRRICHQFAWRWKPRNSGNLLWRLKL